MSEPKREENKLEETAVCFKTPYDEYFGPWLMCKNCGYADNTPQAKYCGGCGKKIIVSGELSWKEYMEI